MLVQDMPRCFPNESGELIHVVESIVYNTPGSHGHTPRDIDRQWSVTTPLNKELQPFAVNQFEPLSDYIQMFFKNHKEIRVRVLGWLKESSAKRAELANRFRKSECVKPWERSGASRSASAQGWRADSV